MKNLYGSISINKKFSQGSAQINESINYYKLKNSKFGIEIEKEENNKKKEKIHIINITEDEDKIDFILKQLVKYEVTPNAEDVIKEFVNQYA